MSKSVLLVLVLAAVSDAGLLRVPKIYNTLITSDANLEPSRAYPIVQPVLTVGVTSVQSVFTDTSNLEPKSEKQLYNQERLQLAARRTFYPYALSDYPFLTTADVFYPTRLLYHQPTLIPSIGFNQQAPPRGAESRQTSVPNLTENKQVHSDVLNNSHRLKNPEIPDVPPPPLPVGIKKQNI